MFAIVGAAGKVGYSTSLALRQAGMPVRAILRDVTKAPPLREIGCEIALADLRDAAALGQALANADAVQVILPPVLQAPDAPGDMRRSIESLAEAVERARPTLLLAISDYGAHVSEDIGMPTMYRHFEQRLRRLKMPKVFLRSAEHMEGWGAIVPAAIATGTVPTMHHPVENTFPNVSARDVGAIAADLLLRERSAGADDDEQIVHAEGPRRYSAIDVAAALSELLGKSVTAQAVPRTQWPDRLGRVVSASTAQLLEKLYDAHHRGLIDIEVDKGEVRYGTTSLIDALRPLVPK